ncbi:MAG: TauD/TfdA family dioxygenase [Hyphomicrobiaceae bacterium]|nr:TauD/TfdA family dioxygenase [Hyphomicrobiaceae bacterium]
MPVSIRQIHDVFAGEVSGVDLTKPLTAEEVASLQAGIDKYAVLVFHGQNLTDEQQIAFSRNFGEIENKKGGNVRTENRVTAEINDVSNLDNDNKPFERTDRRRYFNLGNHLWHSDSSFRAIPAKYSLLSARRIPDAGGNTEFADMRAAYDALDDATRAEVDALICEHSLIFSRTKLGFTFTDDELEMMKPVRQSFVRTHPDTGRRSLYLSSHAGNIIGWPMPEARLFLMNISEFATQPRFVYTHQWKVGDLVMWDNRTTMHRARDYDENQPRDMRRTTIAGEAPTTAQVAA